MTERIPVTLKINRRIDRALELHAAEVDKSKSDITEAALVKYLGLATNDNTGTTQAPAPQEAK